MRPKLAKITKSELFLGRYGAGIPEGDQLTGEAVAVKVFRYFPKDGKAM